MTLTAESLAMVRTAADRLRILTRPDELCLLAVSGGSDSLAMLDLLHNGAESHGRSLAVAHVDHGIDPASERVAATVAYAASARGLRFYCRRLELAAATSETRARTARRAALGAMAREAGAAAVVLAHTADDQAETVLLRVLRGSGPAGLAAMAARRGRWVRPLLAIRRVQLMEHLAARGIEALSDPANADRRHLRSWLR
ncbi:MAG: tRNA lysidine(34) synthetase TilS, partial [Gemmatimonadales bacterium]